MSYRATATCRQCASALRQASQGSFLAPRTFSRLPNRARLAPGPTARRFYSEGELLEAAKAKLGLSDGSPELSESSRRQLEPLSQIWDQHARLQKAREETLRQLSAMKDAEMKELFEGEITDLDAQITDLATQQLPSLLLPPETTDNLPIMISINAGIGGDEATACAALLIRAYQRYAEINRWDVEIISQAEGAQSKGMQGVKEMTMKMKARDGGAGNVYERMRWEGGVHRFQRVPPNDAKGRVQSSTVAVLVLPIIPEGQEAELVDPKDVKMEVMRSRGAGGQHVNKTESAVRLTHLPTGISVSMQDSRSQHQNRAWAWDILRSRLFERKQVQLQADRRSKRQEVISGTDRSDKVRSYNVPQDRVTDHRIGFTSSNMEGVLDGDLDPLIYALIDDYKTRRLQDIISGIDDVDA